LRRDRFGFVLRRTGQFGGLLAALPLAWLEREPACSIADLK
jgi:hypothetical protein